MIKSMRTSATPLTRKAKMELRKHAQSHLPPMENTRVELRSVKQAIKIEELENAKDNENRKSEIGDVLFSIINVCRYLDADPEIQLNQSTSRFIERAKYVEKNFDTNADIGQLWKEAKKSQFK